MGFFSSLRKSMKLRDVSRRLAPAQAPSNLQGMMQGFQIMKQAQEELFDLVEGDDNLRQVMAAHGASRETLRQAYEILCIADCSQWAGGHWVAASALAFPATLDFVLRSVDVKRQFAPASITRLVSYFEDGRTGAV